MRDGRWTVVCAMVIGWLLVSGSAHGQERLRSATFESVFQLFLPAEGEIATALSWTMGAEENSPITWHHAGLRDSPRHLEALGAYSRHGGVILREKGRPLYTVLEKTVQPGAWSVYLVGPRAGVTTVIIDAPIITTELGEGALLGLLPRQVTRRLAKKCPNESAMSAERLYEVKAPGRRMVWAKDEWSCGAAGGCSDGVQLFYDRAQALSSVRCY